jgi:hypothetical protein
MANNLSELKVNEKVIGYIRKLGDTQYLGVPFPHIEMPRIFILEKDAIKHVLGARVEGNNGKRKAIFGNG